MAVKRTGGGTFDPAEPFVFFLAGSLSFLYPAATKYDHLLVAVSELENAPADALDPLLARPGLRLFLDSGIFALTMEHARTHDVTMDQALRLAPADIDGFDGLLTRYVDLAKRLAPQLWGYVELDQGGRDRKRETRAYLESLGLKPIPVYHPLVDGWDYFDELLDGYDRICIGNVVWGSQTLRRDLLFTISERIRRSKRRPWIHVLGHTPNPLFMAVPFNSSDSTSHNYSLRYGSAVTFGRAMLAQFSRLNSHRWTYDREAGTMDTPESWERGGYRQSEFLGWVANTDLRNWRQSWTDMGEALGAQVPTYPKAVKGEGELQR